MARVARQRFLFPDQHPQPVKDLLEQAYNQVAQIPTLIDRVDRLETISDSWQRLGQRERAEFVLRTVVDQRQLEDMSFDTALSRSVELA